MPVIKPSIAPHAAPVASPSTSHSTTPSTTAHSTRPQSSLRNSLPTRDRSPSTDSTSSSARPSTSFRTSDRTPAASTSQADPAAQTPRNVLKNDTGEAQFYPLVDGIRNHDDKYVYVTHGTRLANTSGIFNEGLDPGKGGGSLGAASYEGARNTDSIGNLKYGNDPNVSLRYANAPAEKPQKPEAGVQLEARIPKDQFLRQFDETSQKTQTEPFWRPERGGENNPAHVSGAYVSEMANAMPKVAATGQPVWASESNVPIKPQDIRVIGVSVPPGQSVDTSGLKTEYGE